MKITINSSGPRMGSEREYNIDLPPSVDDLLAATLKLLEALTRKANGSKG